MRPTSGDAPNTEAEDAEMGERLEEETKAAVKKLGNAARLTFPFQVARQRLHKLALIKISIQTSVFALV